MIYIAYGSNMSRSQMQIRTPQAKLIGLGYIDAARLEFYVHATVEKSSNPNDRVPVAVWEIDEDAEFRLDTYEGFPYYYTKEEWTVHMDNGSQIKGLIYIMKEIRKRPPDQDYYEGILSAYFDLGLHDQVENILIPALRRSYARE